MFLASYQSGNLEIFWPPTMLDTSGCEEKAFLILFIMGGMLIKALSHQVLSTLSSFLTLGRVVLCLFSTQ